VKAAGLCGKKIALTEVTLGLVTRLVNRDSVSFKPGCGLFNSSQCQCGGDWWAGFRTGHPRDACEDPRKKKGSFAGNDGLRCSAVLRFASVFSLGLSCLRCLLRSALHVASHQPCVLFPVFFSAFSELFGGVFGALLVGSWFHQQPKKERRCREPPEEIQRKKER
jgi:hypothetical protein